RLAAFGHDLRRQRLGALGAAVDQHDPGAFAREPDRRRLAVADAFAARRGARHDGDLPRQAAVPRHPVLLSSAMSFGYGARDGCGRPARTPAELSGPVWCGRGTGGNRRRLPHDSCGDGRHSPTRSRGEPAYTSPKEVPMLYELRVYHCVPGRLPALLKRFETITLGLRERHGIRQAGLWTVAIGESNQVHFYMLAW